MFKCEVQGCSVTDTELPEDCSLFRYPEDNRLNIWIERTKGKGSTWTPQPNSRICTLHFDTHHFVGSKKKGRLLRGAVPTLHLPRLLPVSSSQPSTPTKSSVPASSNAPVQNEEPSPAPLRCTEPGENLDLVRKPRSKPKFPSAIWDCLNVEEDNNLNKILLKKSIRGLIFHVDDLCKQNQNNPTKEEELRSMTYILHMVQKNMGLSPNEALVLFQEQVPNKIYTSLRRLVKVEKKQFKALVRSFSLSLHFYSVPAYTFIRQKLKGAIPHTRTIQAWYTTIDKYMY